MKLIVLFFIVFSFLGAKRDLLSKIPVPKTRIVNLDIDNCDKLCLDTLIKEGKIFSFMAKYKKTKIKGIDEYYYIYSKIFNLYKINYSMDLKLAIILPYKTIGKYSTSIFKSIFSYLSSIGTRFSIKMFYIEDESYDSIQNIVFDIKDSGFTYVIAPLTSKGVENILDAYTSGLKIYIPTSLNAFNIKKDNIFFGAINYEEQLTALLKYSSKNLALFYDSSSLGKKLHIKTKNIFSDNKIKLEKAVGYKSSDISFLKENKELFDGLTVILNTPVVSSGLVMSQLTFYEALERNILSTQINYDPIILNITQYKDRDNLFIANSIGNYNEYLIEINRLLNNNIEFDWINYSSVIGIDLFFSNYSKLNRKFLEKIKDNTVQYPINIMQAGFSRFKKVD